jgi:hypothetical protein
MPDDEIERLRETNAALTEIIRGLVEAARPGTDPEVRHAAWKRAGVVIQVADARANEHEFLARITERLDSGRGESPVPEATERERLRFVTRAGSARRPTRAVCTSARDPGPPRSRQEDGR